MPDAAHEPAFGAKYNAMINLDELPMRVGLGQFQELSDERLQFIKQCGCDDFQMNTPILPGADRWELTDISQLVQRGTDAGLRLMSIENVPKTFVDKIMLGLPGRELQLDNMAYTIRNLGRAGVPILGYAFMPTGVWRTSNTTPVRGGAKATSFQYATAQAVKAGEKTNFGIWATVEIDREYSEEEIWSNYCWYLERILPVCEEAGVRRRTGPFDFARVNSLAGDEAGGDSVGDWQVKSRLPIGFVGSTINGPVMRQ